MIKGVQVSRNKRADSQTVTASPVRPRSAPPTLPVLHLRRGRAHRGIHPPSTAARPHATTVGGVAVVRLRPISASV